MTPREFERSLGEAGLPEADVGRLTRLFEGARYGASASDDADAQEAITALAAIVQTSAGRAGLIWTSPSSAGRWRWRATASMTSS